MVDKELTLADELKSHVVTFRTDVDKAYFVNLADIHYGYCDKEMFVSTFEYLMSIPNLYVGIGGDSTNNATRTSKSNPNEEWLTGDKQIYELAEILKPYADRILYIIAGNHGAGRMQDTVFYTPELLLATMIGKPEIYKGEFVFLYFNVGDNCFTHFAQHTSPKRDDHWDFINADFTYREHHHQNYVKKHVVVEHNKFAKVPVPKVCYTIWCGTFQVMPSYGKRLGYKFGVPGCYVVEMRKDRKSYVWEDTQFVAIMNERGFGIPKKK